MQLRVNDELRLLYRKLRLCWMVWRVLQIYVL